MTDTVEPVARQIPLAVPVVTGNEGKYLAECVETGFVSSVGPFVHQMEEMFAEAVGARYAVACATGTAALHIALVVAGVGPGDEVACSDFTFIASANAAAYAGARVTLVDSDAGTWCLDPALLLDELGDRHRRGRPLPRAVEVVHILGQPAELRALREFCAESGVVLVEDAAEALGATYTEGELAGRHVGTLGAVGAFSFNGNKIITTGGGGMIVTDDEALARRARHLTTQAKVPDVGYLHDEVGYNYRLTNIAAAVGVAQLERLGEFVTAKRAIAARYDQAFAGTGLTLPPRRPGTESSYWLYSVLMPGELGQRGRDGLLEHLNVRGIGARSLWRPLHLQPPYADAPVLGGAVGADLFARGVSLPCSTDLAETDQQRVIEAVLEFLDGAGR